MRLKLLQKEEFKKKKKKCGLFTDYIGEINNTQINNSKDIDIVIPMYNLIEYSNNYSKTTGSLCQHYRDELFLDVNNTIADFPADNSNSALFKFKIKIASRTENDGTKYVKIMTPLKYLSNIWRTLEMPLTNCEINLILTWSENCFIIDAPV